MKLQKLYEHYDIIKEGLNAQDIKVNYSLNINVDNGNFKAKGDGNFKIGKEIYQTIMSVEDVINLIINEETRKSRMI